MALSKIGAQAINSLTDQTSVSAIQCNQNFLPCYLEAARSGKWNCLLTAALLANIPQTPLPGATGTSSPITAYPWAQFTSYAANTYVTFGGYYYQVLYQYTSTANFLNDLTTGALVQTDTQTFSTNVFGLGASAYASSWGFQYALPADFQYLCILNETGCWDFDGAGGDNYQLMDDPAGVAGQCLFCNQTQAVIQYVRNQPDTTRWDSIFTDAMSYKLAAAIATPLRQDGGKMEATMLEYYERSLRKARARNGGEQQTRRWNPIRDSRFNQARWGGMLGGGCGCMGSSPTPPVPPPTPPTPPTFNVLGTEGGDFIVTESGTEILVT